MGPITFLRGVRNLVLFCSVAALLAAQSGNGVVQGTVLDPTKASIPAAKVTLNSTTTGVLRNTETSSVGFYYFGSVPIGPYTLSVESPGFKKWSGTLGVEAGQTVNINPNMEVGSVEATVELTGAAPVITTQGMGVGDVKDALRIHQLPLNGRSVTNPVHVHTRCRGWRQPAGQRYEGRLNRDAA